MKSVGIICEYNPFHNGHIYHIEKVKEMFPDSPIVLVLSGNVTERGELSILSKWKKTELALIYGVDLVIELPYLYASQAADIFAYGALAILADMGVSYLVFGSELGDIEPFMQCAKTQLYSQTYPENVKKYLAMGQNYPTSMAKALEEETHISITQPNDLLGLCYVKEILKNHYDITPVTIKRTSDYHNLSFEGTISSASSIRNHIKERKSLEGTVPKEVLDDLEEAIFLRDFFPYIRYKILSEKNLAQYETVDENIQNRMKEVALTANSLEEFIDIVKSKYYTHNRIMRMCSHILFSFTKEENESWKDKPYIRILGFNQKGQEYLHHMKKKITLPVLSNYSNDKENRLFLEVRVSQILSLKKGISFFQEEIQHQPITK